MQTVAIFSGPAWQVFRYLALLARYNPGMTIKEMMRTIDRRRGS